MRGLHAEAPSAGSAEPLASRPSRKARGLFGLACLCVLGPTAFLGSSAPVGAAESFPGHGFLPDNRAWEMVSPLDKNGGEVIANTARTRPATVETPALPMAVGFASLAAFGDAIGTGVATDYISQRSTAPDPGNQGWTTHAITPPQKQLSYVANAFAFEPLYEGDFSPDLTAGAFRAFSPVPTADGPHPNVESVLNLYRRDDLRNPGPGSYRLASDAAQPLGGDFVSILFGRPFFAGASDDFDHVLFETEAPRTEDGPPLFSSGLYEWEDGAERLVSRIPTAGIECNDSFGPDCQTAINAHAGQGAMNLIPIRHVISEDGHRVSFTVQTETCGATSTPCGNLYQRIDHVRTVQLNASERTDCAGDPTCGGDDTPDPAPDPGGSQRAAFWDASVDGTRVFFTSLEALTDDAAVDATEKVYMYDAGKPAADPHNLTLINRSQQALSGAARGVIGASADGRTAYFIARGQLVAGAPDLISQAGIFAWHDDGTANGSLAYVGELAHSEDANENVLGNVSANPLRSRVSPDGRHLLFGATSGEGLTGNDHGTCTGNGTVTQQCRELYLYSAEGSTPTSPNLVCASCPPSGAPATADARGAAREGGGASSTTLRLNRPLSDDGRYVFFSSAEALVKSDTNGVSDAYEYDSVTGKVHLLSSGEDKQPSYFMDASPDGRNAFFTSQEALSDWDAGTAADLYVARIDGGFPEPPLPPPSCQGDACQPAPQALNDPTPASSSFSGAGNLSRASKGRCAKGKRKVKTRAGKTRCVKKQKQRKRAANSDRRTNR